MLTLAATPIGNLEDVSLRLKRVLDEADLVFAEDTRHSRKLLSYLGLKKGSRSFHEHSPPSVLENIGRLLEENKELVYISDAGMPGVSDPGFELVRLAIQLEVAVDVIPGPSAVLNALVLSGLPGHKFCFMGFFPSAREKRIKMLQELAQLQMTAIFFEAPSRIKTTLSFLEEQLPHGELALCRELTKLHQQVLRGTPERVSGDLEHAKGEMVLVIGPVVDRMGDHGDPRERYLHLLERGETPNRAIKMVAQENRLTKRKAYDLVHGNR